MDCGHCKAFRYTGEDNEPCVLYECHYGGKFDQIVTIWDRCHHGLTTIDE